MKCGASVVSLFLAVAASILQQSLQVKEKLSGESRNKNHKSIGN